MRCLPSLVEIQEDFQTQEDAFDRISNKEQNAHVDEEKGTWPPRLGGVQVKRVQSGPKVRGNSMYRVTKNPRSQGVLVAGRDSVPTFAGRDSIPTLRAEAVRDTFAGRVLG